MEDILLLTAETSRPSTALKHEVMFIIWRSGKWRSAKANKQEVDARPPPEFPSAAQTAGALSLRARAVSVSVASVSRPCQLQGEGCNLVCLLVHSDCILQSPDTGHECEANTAVMKSCPISVHGRIHQILWGSPITGTLGSSSPAARTSFALDRHSEISLPLIRYGPNPEIQPIKAVTSPRYEIANPAGREPLSTQDYAPSPQNHRK